ncbi:MAG: hypothetical protein IKS54_05835 [Erysipelotrichaceae bacterium]|nr:hypothetical protein [Erysipelotrichaceae bacterium]
MNETEKELVEEYKKLDLLLKDMYQSDTGVSEYISRMELTSGAYVVPGWEQDLKRLKHVRHIRNKIMHEEDDSLCSESDIDFVLDFYDRLMEQDDPLARLHEYRNPSGKERDYEYTDDDIQAEQEDWSYLNRRPLGKLTILLIILLTLAIIVVAIEIIYMRIKGIQPFYKLIK